MPHIPLTAVEGEPFRQLVEHAKRVCKKNGGRLTQLRIQVLRLVWESQKPIGAYAIMDMLEARTNRKKVAPPTVYRVLAFLLEQGLLHKVHSQNTYVACCEPFARHGDLLFICSQCGDTSEVPNTTIQQTVNLHASQNKFRVTEQSFEVWGVCQGCQDKGADHKA